MKTSKIYKRFALVAALLLVAAFTFLTAPGEAIETGHGEEWVVTPAAAARTAAGLCGGASSGRICKEFCYFGQPSGDFLCFFAG